MDRKLLQIAKALAGMMLVGFGRAGELIAAPLGLWQRHIAGAAQHRVLA